MSYAANLGRDKIIAALYEAGATDLDSALARAALQGQIRTARKLYAMTGGAPLPSDALGGPAYTLSASGTALMFEIGAQVRDSEGTTNCAGGRSARNGQPHSVSEAPDSRSVRPARA